MANNLPAPAPPANPLSLPLGPGAAQRSEAKSGAKRWRFRPTRPAPACNQNDSPPLFILKSLFHPATKILEYPFF